jgi:histidinol-phosphate phosphatase family protein
MSKINDLQREWSLFLDRDGVINKRIVGGYIQTPEEFEFLPENLYALKQLANQFKYIFIVSNQQGIGKGLMSETDLELVHARMIHDIEAAGGRINQIFFCPDLASRKNNCRKPSLAMALEAKKEFPSIDFKKSFMVGDSKTDMEFGQKAGMKCIFIRSKAEEEVKGPSILAFDSLLEFSNHLKTI